MWGREDSRATPEAMSADIGRRPMVIEGRRAIVREFVNRWR